MVRTVLLGLIILGAGSFSGVRAETFADAYAVPGSPARGEEQFALERQTFALINAYRHDHDLRALDWNPAIAETARGHSRDMAEGRCDFGHDGFSDRVGHLHAVLGRVRGAGENVLYTSDPREVAHQAVEIWLHSPPHLRNIRGDYDSSGIGVWETTDGVIYFTQIFVKRMADAGGT